MSVSELLASKREAAQKPARGRYWTMIRKVAGKADVTTAEAAALANAAGEAGIPVDRIDGDIARARSVADAKAFIAANDSISQKQIAHGEKLLEMQNTAEQAQIALENFRIPWSLENQRLTAIANRLTEFEGMIAMFEAEITA